MLFEIEIEIEAENESEMKLPLKGGGLEQCSPQFQK